MIEHFYDYFQRYLNIFILYVLLYNIVNFCYLNGSPRTINNMIDCEMNSDERCRC